MSSIFGFLDPSKSLDSRSTLDKMSFSLRHRGALSQCWDGGVVGLGFRGFGVHTPIRAFDAASQVSVFASLRLDNRRELCQHLEVAERSGDGRLLVAAYQRWGDGFVTHLLGDFAFMLWDARRQVLCCATDCFAVSPLFYHWVPGRLLIASEVRALFAAGAPCSMPPQRIARLAYPYQWRAHWEGCFENISMLAPAHCLWADQGGIRLQQYWTPSVSQRPNRLDGWLEKVSDAFETAVRVRIAGSGPTAAMLSGGLDSSAIVARASSLQPTGIHALSIVKSTQFPEVRDEWEFIQSLERPGLEIHPVRAENAGPWDGVARQIWRCEHPYLTSSHFLYSAMATRAAALGCEVLLDGLGGEASLSVSDDGVWSEWFSRGHWRVLLREGLASLRLGVHGRRSLLKRMIKPLLPSWMLRVPPDVGPAFPFQPAFLQEQLGSQAIREYEDITRATFREWPDHRQNQREAIGMLGASLFNPLLREEPVSMRFPLTDRRLIEACLAAPAELKVKDGYPRGLVRAIGHDLPPAVRWRLDKLDFCCDYQHRFQAGLDRVRSFLADSQARRWGEVVDLALVQRLLDLPPGRARNWATQVTIPGAVYLLVFLNNHQRLNDDPAGLSDWCPALDQHRDA